MAVKLARRIIITAILLIVIAAGACFALYSCTAGTTFESARTAALNMALDTSGVKDAIDTQLRVEGASAANKHGIPTSLVNDVVDALQIDNWKVANTPDQSTITSTMTLDVDGSKVELTTYDDPSYITMKSEGKIDTLGQSVTFEVPQDVERLTELLPYVDAASENGLVGVIQTFAQSL